MVKEIFVAFLGLLQGGVIIPLTLYLGLLVRRDLSQRYSGVGSIANFVAPFAIMIMWLAMSYLAADSLLDTIAGSTDARSKAGKLWVMCTFLGLVVLAIVFIAADKTKLLRR